MFKKALALVALLVLPSTGALAQSLATQVTPGFLTTTGCPSGSTVCFVPYSVTNPLPVNASVTASVAGFTPNGNTANLSVTSASADVALPAGTVVKVINWGSTDVHFRVTVGAGTAVTTDEVLKSGAATGVTVGSNTHLSAITDTGTSTISISGGAGLVAGYGGGGSGSGSGTSYAQGSTTVGQNLSPMGCRTLTATPTDTTAQTNIPRCHTDGSVGVTVENNGVAQASTTSGQTISPIGCRTLTSAPTDTTAQTNIPSCDTAGALRVNIATNPTAVAQASTTSGQSVVPAGCRTLSTTPTDTTAQTNMPVCNIRGNLVVSPYTLPDNLIQGTTAAMTGTTSTSLLAAPGANLFNYVTSISCVNSHATVGTFVTVQDGSGGTALATLAAASLFGGTVLTFPAPFKQPTANTALFVADVTTGANVICNASGYKGP